MRTRANIHLDADAYDFASSYAAARGLALGAAISELLRRVRQIPQSEDTTYPTSPRLKSTQRGLLE